MSGPRRRHGSRVLHASPAVPWTGDRGRTGIVRRLDPGSHGGAGLIEVLISLSVFTIGALAVVSLLATGRRGAERAAATAAAALAAQQVLENALVDGVPDSALARDLVVGVHRVRVNLSVESATAGLARVRARAVDAGSGRVWTVETLKGDR